MVGKPRIVLIALVTALVAAGCAQPEEEAMDYAPLEDMIESYLEENNVPGAEVLIARDGEVEFHQALGRADLEIDLTRETGQQFRIASISKTFTALRVLQLHDQRLLDLDDTLDEYFPEFPHADNITIRHLLNMNAGIPDFADAAFLEDWHDDPLMDFSLEEAVEMAAAREDAFIEPGEKVIYTNVNYTLLGLIIEQVTGNAVAEEFEQHLFSELGLEDTIYPTDPDLPGSLRGYSWDAEREEFIDITELNPLVPNTGGAVISSMPDLKVFADALYHGTLLSEETHQEQMQALAFDGEPEWIRYGLGILDMGGFWGHNGTIFGFSSEMYYFAPEDTIIIINVNRSDRDDMSYSTDLFLGIAAHLFPEEVEWGQQN